MDDQDRAREERKQRALERLGTNEPRCFRCPETDWRCLDVHHIAGKKYDPITVIVCASCHRKLSDDQKDHPTSQPGADPFLNSVGHFLLGLGDLLRAVAERLVEFGRALIERAREQLTTREERR